MMKRTKRKKTTGAKSRLSAERIAEMIEEATVDAYDEYEQAIGGSPCSRTTLICLSTPTCSACA